MKPILEIYTLHNLQEHSRGSHFRILNLNSSSDNEFLISSGTIAHVFGPRKDRVSVPWDTVLAEIDLKDFYFLGYMKYLRKGKFLSWKKERDHYWFCTFQLQAFGDYDGE